MRLAYVRLDTPLCRRESPGHLLPTQSSTLILYKAGTHTYLIHAGTQSSTPSTSQRGGGRLAEVMLSVQNDPLRANEPADQQTLPKTTQNVLGLAPHSSVLIAFLRRSTIRPRHRREQSCLALLSMSSTRSHARVTGQLSAICIKCFLANSTAKPGVESSSAGHIPSGLKRYHRAGR